MTVVTDNHLWVSVYFDTVSLVREQFFRLALTSIWNTMISPLVSSLVYACFSHTSKLHYTRYTSSLYTHFEILTNFFGLSLLHSIRF